MIEKKVEIKFPKQRIEEPIISDLIRNSNISLNILKAQVLPNQEGAMILTLSGKNEDLEKAFNYLVAKGVSYKTISSGIDWNQENCVSCGACTSHCPSSALEIDQNSMEVSFDSNKCIECEFCVSICPYHAIGQRA